MCSSDKQNMAVEIKNSVLEHLPKLFEIIEKTVKDLMSNTKNKRKSGNDGLESTNKKIEDIKRDLQNRRTKLKKLVEEARGKIGNGECNGELNEAENCGIAIDFLIHDNLMGNVRNVVNLSVTGLTNASLLSFWSILENFENLTTLGVAVTNDSVITLPNFKDKLKKLKENLKKLQIEGSHSGLKKLSELGELLCLRIYGVCQNGIYKIELKKIGKLKKLVIGHMENVTKVEISSAVLKTVVTLKFSNLPKLKEVTDTNNKALLSREVNPKCPGLKIYHYDKENQCYK